MSLFCDFYSSLFILLNFIHHFLTLSSFYSSISFIHHVSFLRIPKIRRNCHYFAIFIHFYSFLFILFIIIHHFLNIRIFIGINNLHSSCLTLKILKNFGDGALVIHRIHHYSSFIHQYCTLLLLTLIHIHHIMTYSNTGLNLILIFG